MKTGINEADILRNKVRDGPIDNVAADAIALPVPTKDTLQWSRNSEAIPAVTRLSTTPGIAPGMDAVANTLLTPAL